MIAGISGTLVEVNEEAAIIDRDGLRYEVLVPGYALGELTSCRGQQVLLHTLEYYEGSPGGGNLIPRLIGFPRPEEKAFFNRFVSVKGIGLRKALKALAEPIAVIASAIETGDVASLARLPGVGKRAANQIVAELRGKLGEFALAQAAGPTRPQAGWTQPQRDAIEILVAVGERRQDAERWLERAAQLHPDIDEAEAWVKAAYRIKVGVEG